MSQTDLHSQPLARPATLSRPVRLGLAVVLGAIAVALAAQAEIKLPFTPIPVTLQGGMVALVGAVLGARLGAAALVTYLAAGAIGIPVFAGGGAGAFHLVGPTGGYLLAFPVAAAVAGSIARPGAHLRSILAVLAGIAVIFIGGMAQLMVLGLASSPAAAWSLGAAPFIGGDLVEGAIAGLLAARLRGPVSRRLQ